MKIKKVNKTIKKVVDRFVNKEWGRFNKEKGYLWKEKKYSFAVFENNKVIGYIEFKINGGAGYLSQLLVLKESRKKGAGKILMDKFEEFLKKYKCHKAYLETSEKHKEALKFYKKLGYKVEAKLKDNKFHFDWYFLTKKLK